MYAILMSRMQTVLRGGVGIPVLVLMLLAMVVVPLPPLMLDMLFTFNISLAMIVLLGSVYTRKPLDLSVYPTILLLTTLLRLSLNIASTRVVLLHGHTGTDAAGRVIEAFGRFVVGGNYAVGIVIFAILVVINFVVITKGASRISEVSARFTLDSMPGKQMAVDADLNAGLITQEQALARRAEIVQEADFYGAMDGASKFVRGDAVAGIIITMVTIIGGLVIGVVQHNMALGQAMENYALLTIGDGLVAQIPALVLSTSAGIIVTRVSSAAELGSQVINQLFERPRVLYTTAAVMASVGLVPGMPNVAFLTLAGTIAGIAYMIGKKQQEEAATPPPVAAAPPPTAGEPVELSWDDVQPVDLIGLEVGYRLIPLVDKNQGGQLMGRIKGVRKKLSQDLGFLIPAVHIRDNLDLSPNSYRITLMGVSVGEAEIHTNRELAINPGQVFGDLDGIKVKDPAFGLPAIWINSTDKDHAQSLGYTVVDASTVVATHLSHLLQLHAHELLGREEVQNLLNKLAASAPKLVEELVPKSMPLGTVVKVLKNLLAENVPIRDIRGIAESLADNVQFSQDPVMLTAAVRVALGRSIVQQVNGMDMEIPVMTLDQSLEHILHQATKSGADEWAGIEPGLAERLQRSLASQAQRQEMAGQPAILLVSAMVRPLLSKLLRHVTPTIHVLAFNEIPDNRQIRIVASIGGKSAA